MVAWPSPGETVLLSKYDSELGALYFRVVVPKLDRRTIVFAVSPAVVGLAKVESAFTFIVSPF